MTSEHEKPDGAAFDCALAADGRFGSTKSAIGLYPGRSRFREEEKAPSSPLPSSSSATPFPLVVAASSSPPQKASQAETLNPSANYA
jgi:hypothetical protein